MPKILKTPPMNEPNKNKKQPLNLAHADKFLSHKIMGIKVKPIISPKLSNEENNQIKTLNQTTSLGEVDDGKANGSYDNKKRRLSTV